MQNWNPVFKEETGLNDTVQKLDDTINLEEVGLQNRVLDLEKVATDMNQNIEDMQHQLEAMKEDQDIISGYLSKHDAQLRALQDKSVELTAKSMENNISISGLEEMANENCLEVMEFITRVLRINNARENPDYKIKEAF